MTNYREILRLHSLGLNKSEIASSCRCARNTVAATLQRAANCNLQWPLPEGMSDKQLSERLFPSGTAKPAYKMPDYRHEGKNRLCRLKIVSYMGCRYMRLLFSRRTTYDFPPQPR